MNSKIHAGRNTSVHSFCRIHRKKKRIAEASWYIFYKKQLWKPIQVVHCRIRYPPCRGMGHLAGRLHTWCNWNATICHHKVWDQRVYSRVVVETDRSHDVEPDWKLSPSIGCWSKGGRVNNEASGCGSPQNLPFAPLDHARPVTCLTRSN